MENLERSLKKNTLAVPAIGLATGIATALGFYSNPFDPPPLWSMTIIGTLLMALAGVIYVIILNLSKGALRTFSLRSTHYLWLFLIFAGAGISVLPMHLPQPVPTWATNNNVVISGVVTSTEIKEQGMSLSVRPSNIAGVKGERYTPVNLNILVPAVYTDADIDSKVSFAAKLEPVKKSDNSFFSTSTAYLHRKGILYRAYVQGDIMVTGHTRSLTYFATRLRNAFEISIEATPLPTPIKHFFICILLGDREYLDTDTRALFAATGTAHILALSGMHIAIIAAIILFILFPLNFTGRYKLRVAVSMVMIWLYAVMSGLSPSTLRACIMYTFFAVATLMERHNSPFNSLYGAALLILLFSPLSVLDTGFQLSFLCVGSLIAFADILNPFMRRQHFLYTAAGGAIATLTATLSTWIVSAHLFGTVPLNFFLPNLLILPLLPGYVSIAIIYFAAHSLGLEIAWLGQLITKVYNFTLSTLANAGSGSLFELYIPWEGVVLWLVALAIAALRIHIFRIKWVSISAATLAIISLVSVFTAKPDYPAGSMIIGSGFKDIPLTIKSETQEVRHLIPRYSITKVSASDANLLFVDTTPDNTDINNQPTAATGKSNHPQQYDWIIIGGGYTQALAPLIARYHPHRIALHNTLRRTREEELTAEADSLSLPIHSIRHRGPILLPSR